MQQRTVTCYGQSNSIPAGKKKTIYDVYTGSDITAYWSAVAYIDWWVTVERTRSLYSDRLYIREENENCYSFTLSQITRLRVHVHAFYFADKQKTNLVKTYGEKHYFQMT